jgi:hypothetical protein
MSLVLLVCTAPVFASYLTYFLIRPSGRSNYSELIVPTRLLPDIALTDLNGEPVHAASLKGQWLLIAAAGGNCDIACEKTLYLQRQLRETLGKERDRVENVWFVTDKLRVRPEVLHAVSLATQARILRVGHEALGRWLVPAPGRGLNQHLYIADPMGYWMMRAPQDPEPAKLKGDIKRLLRASASWDRPGR